MLKTANCLSLKINPSASEIWPRNEPCYSSSPKTEFITLESGVMWFLTGVRNSITLTWPLGGECVLGRPSPMLVAIRVRAGPAEWELIPESPTH